jgi:hypothetical protein
MLKEPQRDQHIRVNEVANTFSSGKKRPHREICIHQSWFQSSQVTDALTLVDLFPEKL